MSRARAPDVRQQLWPTVEVSFRMQDIPSTYSKSIKGGFRKGSHKCPQLVQGHTSHAKGSSQCVDRCLSTQPELDRHDGLKAHLGKVHEYLNLNTHLKGIAFALSATLNLQAWTS